LRLDYRLVGVGWAEAEVSHGVAAATVTASYLADALGDLLRAVGALGDGAATVRCAWAEEPGETRWLLAREDADVDVRIVAYDAAGRRDEEGAEVFRARVPYADLRTAVVDAAERVLAEHGEDGYLAKWVEAPFPCAALDRLRATKV
jgi:hypothetical protein